jgi:hypothetical protein
MKVLGLIETPDDLVTKEYVDKKSNEIKKAGYITTATADGKYQPKGDYATKDSVNNASKAVSDLTGKFNSLPKTYLTIENAKNEYTTKKYVDGKLSPVTTEKNGLMTANDKAKLDGINLTNYLLKSQLPDVSKFITTATADNKYQPKGNYQPRGDYAQKNEVIDKKYGTPIPGLMLGMTMIALSAGHGFDRQIFESYIREIIGPYLDSKGNRIGNTLKKEELNPNGLLKFFTRDENKIIYIDDKAIPLVDLLTHKLFNLNVGVRNQNKSSNDPVKVWVGTQTEYDEQKGSITSDILTFIKPDILLGKYNVESAKPSSTDFFKGKLVEALYVADILDKEYISFSLEGFKYMGIRFKITEMQVGGQTYINHDDKITIPIGDIRKYIIVNTKNTNELTLIKCIFKFISPGANNKPISDLINDLNAKKTEYVLTLTRVTDENGKSI